MVRTIELKFTFFTLTAKMPSCVRLVLAFSACIHVELLAIRDWKVNPEELVIEIHSLTLPKVIEPWSDPETRICDMRHEDDPSAYK